MPFLGTIALEFDDVVTDDVSREAVLAAARRVPRDTDDWSLTLTRPNEDFMDATMNNDASFHVHWTEDAKGFFCDAVDEELLARLLDSFYENDKAWKRMCEWQERKKAFSLRGLLRKS
jgi:hypothetical protein